MFKKESRLVERHGSLASTPICNGLMPFKFQPFSTNQAFNVQRKEASSVKVASSPSMNCLIVKRHQTLVFFSILPKVEVMHTIAPFLELGLYVARLIIASAVHWHFVKSLDRADGLVLNVSELLSCRKDTKGARWVNRTYNSNRGSFPARKVRPELRWYLWTQYMSVPSTLRSKPVCRLNFTRKKTKYPLLRLLL